MSERWTVYCDGGCAGNPGPAGFGVVVLPPGGGTVENSGYFGHGTNQVAELTAAIQGLQMTPPGAQVLLLSDSQYTLKGIAEWRAGWQRKGMKTAAGKPVANAQLWMQLWVLADERRVTTCWVKGHSGDRHNERCDALAAHAIRSRPDSSSPPPRQPKR